MSEHINLAELRSLAESATAYRPNVCYLSDQSARGRAAGNPERDFAHALTRELVLALVEAVEAAQAERAAWTAARSQPGPVTARAYDQARDDLDAALAPFAAASVPQKEPGQ